MGNRRDRLDDLIAQAREISASDAELEAQRRSFAYGTAHIENEAVTRDMIDDEADKFSS